ncbi:MAG: endolytic transglycosylase MltG [Porticoccaceae bacterium]|nr:endolytic transglycosylase MltG [Porticoccaceae bacterium]
MLRRVALTFLAAIAVCAVALWWWFQEAIAQPLAIAADGYELTVSRGAGLNVIADDLVDESILESSLVLKIYARLYGLSDIKAGGYQLSSGETLVSLLAKLTSGAVQQHKITFPEGWTLKQWRAALAGAKGLDQTLGGRTYRDIADSLAISRTNPEGWFAPDTYAYVSGDSDLSILRRAYQQMAGQLESLWAEREAGLPYENPYEALIMASIIEKETGVPDERPQIAGVFVLRLQKGMRLQTDPTVIYGLGEGFQGNLTRQHLRQASAYNTYLNTGLPPTPIANPGLAAIKAALHPAVGKALFFVGKGDGSHYFSISLDEHNRAVRKYQIKSRAKAYRSSPLSDKSATTK